MSPNRDQRLTRRTVLRLTGAGALGTAALGSVSGQAPSDGLAFGQQTYVDEDRAGGEPTVHMHPDGTLLYSAHAGTTHFYAPEAADQDSTAFAENYRGQAYYWWSDDLGDTWHFADRLTPPDGVPGSGFSDPEFAVDMAGNIYISEINLVNVAVSKSTDSGRTYELQNFFGQVMEDRQWMTADRENELYMTGTVFAGGTFPNDPVGNFGRHLWKSSDGGETFIDAANNTNGVGEIHVDKSEGILYECHFADNTLSMSAFRGIRQDDFKRDINTIAKNVSLGSEWPSYESDYEGNLYVTWIEDGGGDRSAGVYYSYSTDQAKTWAAPTRVDDVPNTDLWPWLAVGDPGRVGITWLRASKKLPNHNPEAAGDHVWRVMASGTTDGLSDDPTFATSVATPRPVHQGTICDSGTICQAQGVDRRLGDFFTCEIDNTGRFWIGYPDTYQGGAVCLPGFVRQTDGMYFYEQDENGQRGPPFEHPGRGKGR